MATEAKKITVEETIAESNKLIEETIAQNKKLTEDNTAQAIKNEGQALTAEETITIEVPRHIPAFSVYLSVGGEQLSKPNKGRAQNLFRPTEGSLDHHVTCDVLGPDQSFLTIQHNACGIKLSKPSVGETRVFIKDMQGLELKVITDKIELMRHIKKYCKDIEQPSVAGAIVIEFTATEIDHNVNWLAKRQLNNTKTHAKHALQTLASKALGNKAVHFQMLVLQSNSDFTAHTESLQGWEKGINALRTAYSQGNPLDLFFNGKQVQDLKMLPLSAIPYVAAENFPGVGTLPKHTRYHSKYQQAVYHMLGTKVEHTLEVIRKNQMAAQEFDAVMLPCAGVKDAKRALMIVLPGGSGHLLPQDGEHCNVKPPVIKKPAEMNDDLIQSVVDSLKAIVERSGAEDGDPGGYIAKSCADGFKKPLTAKEAGALVQKDGEEADMWVSRLFAFVDSRRDNLVLPTPTVQPIADDSSTSEEEDPSDDDSVYSTTIPGGRPPPKIVEDRGCGAIRIDISYLKMCPDWQVYLVTESAYMRKEGLTFDFKDTEGRESFDQFITRVTTVENLQKATISVIESDKALKKQVQAMNMFVWPDSIQQKVSDRSREAYDYLLRFKETEAKTNLFEELEGLKAFRDGKAPKWLVELIEKMDESKQNALQSLQEMPSHVKFMPGVAASGKSTFLLTLIMLMFFGTCGDEKPENCKPAELKVLACAPNNAALDTLARSAKKFLDQRSIKGLDVVRMYGYDSEIDALKRKRTPYSDPFDQVEATSKRDDFTEADKLLAAYYVVKASVDIHTAKDERTKAKIGCRDMALHEAVARYLYENKETYGSLLNLLNSIGPGQELSKDQSSALKMATKSLYRDFLTTFKGIVCATPMAAANHEFRSFFRPDLVVVDEAGRLQEIELMSIIAFYDGPYIIVGDQMQFRPYINFDPTAKNAVQSQNPFARQLTYSTLERAVDAGAVDAYFTFNHRAYAQLSTLPSELIYRGVMGPYRSGKHQYPDSVKSFNKFLKEIVPELPGAQNRVMITLPGSWVSYIGTSARNLAHARWAVSQAIRAINDQSLTGLRGEPIEILMMPYYRAQVQTYQELLQKALLDNALTSEQRGRIRVATLDASQGDEADMTFIDLTRTDDIGFCGDERRQCLALTRGRQAEIILGGPAMYLGWQEKPEFAARAAILENVYAALLKAKAVASVYCCVKCEEPGATHLAAECTKPSPSPAPPCGCPKQHASTKECDSTLCHRCHTRGHRTSTCDAPIACFRCHSQDHAASDCHIAQVCGLCGKGGHFAHECTTTCKLCRQMNDHQTDECPMRVCQNCGRLGHVSKECDSAPMCRGCHKTGHIAKDCPDKPKPQCRICQDTGHMARDCPKKDDCRNCGQTGHKAKECPTAGPKTCHICGSEGHIKRDCPFEQTSSTQATEMPLSRPEATLPGGFTMAKYIQAFANEDVEWTKEDVGWKDDGEDAGWKDDGEPAGSEDTGGEKPTGSKDTAKPREDITKTGMSENPDYGW